MYFKSSGELHPEGSYRTYEEWKHHFNDRLYVKLMASSYRTYEEWKHHLFSVNNFPFYVLTVPMRNGNYPLTSFVMLTPPRSYRTYEEWKLDDNGFNVSERLGSYRTYEEWKHISKHQSIIFCCSVLTVPMRNGNVT